MELRMVGGAGFEAPGKARATGGFFPPPIPAGAAFFAAFGLGFLAGIGRDTLEPGSPAGTPTVPDLYSLSRCMAGLRSNLTLDVLSFFLLYVIVGPTLTPTPPDVRVSRVATNSVLNAGMVRTGSPNSEMLQPRDYIRVVVRSVFVKHRYQPRSELTIQSSCKFDNDTWRIVTMGILRSQLVTRRPSCKVDTTM